MAASHLPPPAFDRESDVEILAQETVFQGYFRVDRYRLRHKLFAGGWSRPFQRELFERGHAAAVLPQVGSGHVGRAAAKSPW